MVSHTLVKDVLMELGDETEYYTVNSGNSEPLDIRLGKRYITYWPLRGFKPHPPHYLKLPNYVYFLAVFAK